MSDEKFLLSDEQYIKEYENMSLCDLAEEFVVPLFDVKDRNNLLKIIYINYAYERDKVDQLEEKMNEILDRNIKYNVEIVDLQQENQRLKELIECLKLGVTLNQEQEELLDKVLFSKEVNE